MIRRPPRSTLFPYNDALPISEVPPRNLGTSAALIALRYVRPNCGADRKSTRLNSSHVAISYAVFCLKKKKGNDTTKRIGGHKRSDCGNYLRAQTHVSYRRRAL